MSKYTEYYLIRTSVAACFTVIPPLHSSLSEKMYLNLKNCRDVQKYSDISANLKIGDSEY